MNTNEITLYNRIQNPVEAALQLGTAFSKSGLFGCEKVETGQVLALACLAENKTPFEIARTYDIVEGKLRMKALAIFAEFRNRGGKVKWLDTGKDGKKAAAEFTFEGQTLTETFTIEEARTQGLIRSRSAWEKTPANMLRARVLSNAIAMLCPEILAGASGNPEDESEAAPTESKQIFQTPKPEPKKVEITSPPAETKTAEPAPSQPIDVPHVDLVAKAEIDPATGRLTAATVATLERLIGEANATKALECLIEKGKLKKDQSLFNLSVPMAQNIIDRRDAFIQMIGGGK
jgi:hypothetical protein